MRQMKEFWVYSTGPVDNWFGWRCVETTLADLLETGDELVVEASPEEFAELAFIARKLVEKVGWEGDGHWWYSMLPLPDMSLSQPLFAVKQSNNGVTFFCSPIRLHWLCEGPCDATEERFSVAIPYPKSTIMDWVDVWGLKEAYIQYQATQALAIAERAQQARKANDGEEWLPF